MRNLDNYSQAYQELPFEHTLADFRRKLVLERIIYHAPGACLEVGCADEPIFLHTNPKIAITTIEPAFTFFQCAEKQAETFQNVKVINECVEDFVSSEDYDFIIVSGVLHEVLDPTAVLASLKKLAQPETMIHINVPNASSLHRQLAKAMGLIESVFEVSETQQMMQQQQRPFDMLSLTKLVETNGFKVSETGGYFVKPFTHAQMEFVREMGVLNADMLEGLFHLGTQIPALASEIWLECRL